jgi:diguanylate cyclase (GGDEF)-like protein
MGPSAVLDFESYDSYPPEKFIVEVFSELAETTVARGWRQVNVLLRLSMLAGLQMQLEAALNMLTDFGGEIVAHDLSLTYFWEESEDQLQPRVVRGLEEVSPDVYRRGNIFHFWATKYARPLLVSQGNNIQADAFLHSIGAGSALIVPLLVSNRVLGSLQLFARTPAAFTKEDAQLLWILALVGESQLTREYANEGLLRFAFTDYLTGLKTRGYFEQQLDLEIKRCERKKEKFALLMIDIDHFKQLNDTHGHHVGDQVLRDVSAILMKDMREVDTVARYGGEEFVIILPETSGPGARFVAERLRRAVESSRFFAGSANVTYYLTISIGVAVFDSDAQFKRDLIEFADAALYAAKAEGRNRVVLYDEMESKNRGRLADAG